MMIFKKWVIALSLAVLLFISLPAAAANLDFIVNTNEAVTVDTTGGTPQLALTISSSSRVAAYVSGSGSTALTFRYAVQAGDFDADGVTVTPPVDPNGGTLRDAVGNDLVLTYTPPATGNVRVQTYTISFLTDPVTPANQTAVQLELAKAPLGATYNYSISSSGGGGTVTGSGTVTTAPQTISPIDVTSLPSGTLTASLTVTAGSGTGAARTATVAKNTDAILDGLASTSAAYGLRSLRSAYVGPLVRVRRSSDSATQDISALADGNLDEASLSTFCGAGSCFVETWFDQSGNGIDAVQLTPGNQPVVVNTGTIIRLGGRPAVQINPSHALTATGITWDAYSLSTVVRHFTAPTDVHALAIKRSSTAASEFFWFFWNSTGRITWDQNGGAGANRLDTGFTPTLNTNYVYTLVRPSAGTNRTQYVNGAVQGTSTTNQNVANTLPLTIGNDPGTSTRGLNGLMGEFIVWSSALTTLDRTTLEANQSAYYGI